MWRCGHLLLGWWLVGPVLMLGAEEQDPIKVLQQITNRHRRKKEMQQYQQKTEHEDSSHPFLLKVNNLKKSRMIENKGVKDHNARSRTDRFMRKMGKVPSKNVIKIKWRKLSKEEITRNEKKLPQRNVGNIRSSKRLVLNNQNKSNQVSNTSYNDNTFKGNDSDDNIDMSMIHEDFLKISAVKKINKLNPIKVTPKPIQLKPIIVISNNPKLSSQINPSLEVKIGGKKIIDNHPLKNSRSRGEKVTILRSHILEPSKNTKAIKNQRLKNRELQIEEQNYKKEGRSTFGFSFDDDLSSFDFDDRVDIPEFQDFAKLGSENFLNTKGESVNPIQSLPKKDSSIPSYSAALKTHTYTDKYKPPTKTSATQKPILLPKPTYRYAKINFRSPVQSKPASDYPEYQNHEIIKLTDTKPKVKIAHKPYQPALPAPVPPKYSHPHYLPHQPIVHINEASPQPNPVTPFSDLSLGFPQFQDEFKPVIFFDKPFPNPAEVQPDVAKENIRPSSPVLVSEKYPYQKVVPFTSFETVKLGNKDIYGNQKSFPSNQEEKPHSHYKNSKIDKPHTSSSDLTPDKAHKSFGIFGVKPENHYKNSKIDIPHSLPSGLSTGKIQESSGFFGDFSQPSFSSFELPSLDLSIESQRDIFGPGPWPGTRDWGESRVPGREGRGLGDHGDQSELGGEGGAQGSYNWWSAHPVLSWSSQQFHGA